MQKQNNLASLGDEVSMRVNTLDMLRKATWNVKARVMGAMASWTNKGCKEGAIKKKITPKTLGHINAKREPYKRATPKH